MTSAFRERVGEKISRGGGDTVAQSGGGDVPLRDRFDRREIEGNGAQMRMFFGGFKAEQAGRAADVAEVFVF